MRLSAHEQRLLDFGRDQFGEHLSQFILAGLGEGAISQRGRFTIAYVSGENVALKRRVEALTYEPEDGSSYLPCGRHPLVLLALLRLLMNGDQGSLHTLRYEQKEVLSLLGWKDIRRAYMETEEAIERYFLLTYEWKMNKKELAHRGLAFYTASESIISEYQTIDEEIGESAQEDRIFNKVIFNAHFIEQLRRRELFGIDWNYIRSLSTGQK